MISLTCTYDMSPSDGERKKRFGQNYVLFGHWRTSARGKDAATTYTPRMSYVPVREFSPALQRPPRGTNVHAYEKWPPCIECSAHTQRVFFCFPKKVILVFRVEPGESCECPENLSTSHEKRGDGIFTSPPVHDLIQVTRQHPLRRVSQENLSSKFVQK